MVAKSPVAPFASFVYTIQSSGLELEGKKYNWQVVRDVLL